MYNITINLNILFNNFQVRNIQTYFRYEFYSIDVQTYFRYSFYSIIDLQTVVTLNLVTINKY